MAEHTALPFACLFHIAISHNIYRDIKHWLIGHYG